LAGELKEYYFTLAIIYLVLTFIFSIVDLIILIINGCCYYDEFYSWMFIYLVASLLPTVVVFIMYLNQKYCQNDHEHNVHRRITVYPICLVHLILYGLAIKGLINENAETSIYKWFLFTISITFLNLLIWILLPIYVYFFKSIDYLSLNDENV